MDLAFRLGRGVKVWGHGLAFRWMAVFLLLAFLALVAVGVALLWRQGSSGAATRPDDALATLRMRYARGEMTREEFLLAHEDLGGAPPPPPPAPPPSA